jgi:hypothetical protein
MFCNQKRIQLPVLCGKIEADSVGGWKISRKQQRMKQLIREKKPDAPATVCVSRRAVYRKMA